MVKFSYGCQNCRVTVSNYQNYSVSWERRGNLISAVNRLTKEITPKNIFYRNEIQYRDDVPTKRKVGM